MPRRAARTATEHQEQAAVIAWWVHACRGYGLPEFSLFAIPNGAHLAGDARGRAIKMANLKRAGLRPGIPDLFLAVPHLFKCLDGTTAHIPGLWIEMKRKPNRASKEQEDVLRYFRERGYHAWICWTADEAIRAIKGYLQDSRQQATARKP